MFDNWRLEATGWAVLVVLLLMIVGFVTTVRELVDIVVELVR